MDLPPSWVFGVCGALVAVIAALLTNIIASRRDKQREDIESKLVTIESEIARVSLVAQIQREMANAIKVLEFLEVVFYQLIPISKALTPQELTHQENTRAMRDTIVFRAVERLANLYDAATGNRCAQEQADEWASMVRNMKDHDKTAQEKFIQVDEELTLGLVARSEKLIADRDRLKIDRLSLDLRAERMRYWGALFQIIGIVILLMKDLAPS
jgi:hypothetical protein